MEDKELLQVIPEVSPTIIGELEIKSNELIHRDETAHLDFELYLYRIRLDKDQKKIRKNAKRIW